MRGAAVSSRQIDADVPARPRRAPSRPAPAAAVPAVPAAPATPATPVDAELVVASSGSARVDEVATAGKGAARAEESHPVGGDLLLYLLLTVLGATAWQVSQMRLFKPNGDPSYWIGVVGASMMLLLFSYPLRKHVRVLQGLGKVKSWFWVHLFLGIAGPWLILVHSSFHIGSVNAGVALISMLIVVASGVVGRFIYVRVHRGLHGEETSLHELRQRAGMVESNARSRLRWLPTVEARLLAFERREILAKPTWVTHLSQITLLPLQQHIAYLRCVGEVRRRLRALQSKRGWSDEDLRRRERSAKRLVERYLNAVVRVVQYKAYERVFALWHLAHLPFVYMLVISAVVHVIAVHAY